MKVYRKSRSAYSIITFFSASVVTLLAMAIVYYEQREDNLHVFENLTQRQTDALQRSVLNDINYIGAAANFFHSNFPENWGQFSVFAHELINNSPSLITLQWQPKVEVHEINDHVAKARKIFPDYRLYTIPKDGKKTYGYVMKNQAPIFVMSDIYPRTPVNIGLLGFYSTKLRFELVLESMRETRQANVSDKVRLLADGLDADLEKRGLLVYLPVFDQQHNKTLIGVVVGVVLVDMYFNNLMNKTASEQDLLIRVTDMGYDSEDEPVLFQSPNWDKVKGAAISKTLELPNRRWIIDYKMPQPYTRHDQLALVAVGIGGLLMAFMLGFIVHLLARERQRLSVMLEERTAELRFLVEHDSLTGLFNRRAFNQFLEEYIKARKPFSLVTFDIDHFKSINDQYGHIVGDEMLIHVSRLIEKALKPNDLFMRMGGDEFCIISREIDPGRLHHYMNGVRAMVHGNALMSDVGPVICSLSIGAAVHQHHDAEQILRAADEQLYVSKENGRNRVTVAGFTPG